VAFKGPSAIRERMAPGVFTFTAKDYVDVFKDKGVSCVVRLNEADSYDRQDFVCVLVYICIYMHTHMYKYTCIYIYMCICIYSIYMYI